MNSGHDHDSATSDDDLEAVVVDGAAPAQPTSGGGQGWAISLAVHALFALVFWAVVWATHDDKEEYPPIQLNPSDPVAKKEEPKIRALESKEPINIKVENETPAPITLDPTPEAPQTPDDAVTDQMKGDPNKVASFETGSTGPFLAIGAAGGGGGLFGNRGPGGHRRSGGPGSGITYRSEEAVGAALRWFKRHQSPNGMWDAEKYPVNCDDTQKCEPGSIANVGGSDANIAMTGYALMCFLGAGYDQTTPNKYKMTVQRGIDYLRSTQKADGLFGERNYEHAIATMALAEAYAMGGSHDDALRAQAQRGVNIILARQNKDAKGDAAYGAGLGWDYRDANAARNDASVSGWNVMALKSALAAGLNVGNGLGGAQKWLERSWKAANPDWQKLSNPYEATSTFPYTWDATNDKVEVGAPGSDAHDMAAVGAMCAVFLGHHAGDMMLESLLNHSIKYQLPAAWPCNTYYLYYNTYAMFQAGGKRWDQWNDRVRDMLIGAQRKNDGCFDGSWDWQGTKFHGNDVGRVLSTAYGCLCLEVYYRDARQNEMTKHL